MPLPTAITDLSQTAASNYPSGTDSPAVLDDVQRAHASFIALLRDGKGRAAEVSVASAATVDIGALNSEFVNITGTTTITSFGTNYTGLRILSFAGSVTLTYNATTMQIAGGASYTTAAGDVVIAVPYASGWRVQVIPKGLAASGANSDITSLNALQSINGGPIRGLNNRLINGAMSIDQEFAGASVSFAAGAALKYAIDQWYGYCAGANVTGQRVAGTSPNQYNYRFYGVPGVTKIGFAQRIEAANTQDMAGKTATLSVDLSNDLLTTVTWTAWYANNADTFGTLASPTRTQIATGTFTVSSTLARYSAQIAIPSIATTGIEIEFAVGAQTSGTWTIGRAQLELGSAATSFDVRPVGLELSLCQRYYYITQAQLNVSSYSAGAGQPCFVTYSLPVTMRTTPTITSASWTSGVNAVPQTFRMADSKTVESSIISGAAGAFSAVANFGAFSARL